MTYLGEIFTIRKGRKEVKSFENTSLRYIQIDDLRNNDYLKYCVKNHKNVLCDPSDILIAWDGANAGTIGYGLKGAIGSTIAKLSTERKDVFIPYVGKFLQSKSKYLRERCTGATIPHISRNELDKIKIPLPSLETQKKIAALLDKADELRRNDQKILEKYDQLAQSVFLEMFGDPGTNVKDWPIKQLSEIALNEKNAIKAGPFGSSLKKEYYSEKGYKIYGQEQVIRDDFDYGNYYINDERYRKLENCKIQSGDILISLVGTFGQISIVPDKFETGIINPRLMKITLNKQITLPIFIKKILLTNSVRKQIENFSHGGTMGIVNVGIMKKIKIPVPPIILQKRFEVIIQQIENQKQITQQSLQKSEDLFQSLLQRAFKGELL